MFTICNEADNIVVVVVVVIVVVVVVVIGMNFLQANKNETQSCAHTTADGDDLWH
jgi:hypothetical protein